MQDSKSNFLCSTTRPVGEAGEISESSAPPPRSLFSGHGALMLAALVGGIAAMLAVRMSALSLKQILLGIFVAAIVPIAAITKQTRTVLLMAWILSLTYFRVSFPIRSMAGFQGFYVTIADAVFLLLLGYWLYESTIARRPMVAHGPPLLWFFLPFLAACFVSAALA